MVECAGLEIRYTVFPYRGFESLLLRQFFPIPFKTSEPPFKGLPLKGFFFARRGRVNAMDSQFARSLRFLQSPPFFFPPAVLASDVFPFF